MTNQIRRIQVELVGSIILQIQQAQIKHADQKNLSPVERHSGLGIFEKIDLLFR